MKIGRDPAQCKINLPTTAPGVSRVHAFLELRGVINAVFWHSFVLAGFSPCRSKRIWHSDRWRSSNKGISNLERPRRVSCWRIHILSRGCLIYWDKYGVLGRPLEGKAKSGYN